MMAVLKKLTYKKEDIINNLKSNFLFFISAVALVILNIQNKALIICQAISVILIFLTLTQIKNVFGKTKCANKILKILAMISTIGIAYYMRAEFFNNILKFDMITSYLDSHLIERGVFAARIGYILMLISMFSIYTLVVLIFDYLSKIYKDVFSDISKLEKKCYVIIAIFIILVVTIIYNNTNAFYGNIYVADVIFTCDIGLIVNGNAYMNIYHNENDIRQPLFAFLAMPFIGISYALSLAIPFNNVIQPILFDVVQVLILLFSNFILAKLLKIDSKARILFLILTMCTYMNLLYVFSMEQYVIAYFWLITCIYTICNNKQEKLIVCAAGGSLVTSLFLSIWIPKNFSIKKIKKYILELITIGVIFLYLILIFGRLDIFIPKTLKNKTKDFATCMISSELTFENKLQQYSEYIKNCFLKPSVEIRGSYFCPFSIQLKKIDTFNFIGILILILSILGFIVSRKEKLSKIALSWIIFSAVILGILGWGAVENGMILYSLYFGWAFLILIYQLINEICKKIKFKYAIHIVTIVLILIFATSNLLALKELFGFAITNYPVVWI